MTQQNEGSEKKEGFKFLTPERIAAEKEQRPGRLERLTAEVERLFSGENYEALREKITRSFEVPQWGEYHNEGILMDTHLNRMIEVIESFDRGEGGGNLPEKTRASFNELVKQYGDTLKKYVFLHDISKPDLLRIQWDPKAGEKKGRAWEGNIEEFRSEHGLSNEETSDPQRMAEFFSSQGIKGVSYYHQGIENENGRKTESAKHGEHGAEHVGDEYEGVVDVEILKAIELHEAAYQFEKVKPDTYKKLFGELSEEHKQLALFASYIDTASSYRQEGEPDLTNFSYLLTSKDNAESIEEITSELSLVGGLDKKKLESYLRSLLAEQTTLNIGNAVEKGKKEAKTTEYSLDTLKLTLDEVAEKGEITNEEAMKVYELVSTGSISEIGRTFGKKMKIISAVLKASEKQD